MTRFNLFILTDKKEKILDAALELFANEGYNAVSTSKIAKKAGVSEGLIFRHFEHKKGLLHAIMLDTETRLSEVFGPVIFEQSPQKVIRMSLELPFCIDEKEYDYWRLQYKLKWEAEYNHPEKMKPFLDKLQWAFTVLGYKNPELEAKFIEHSLDALAIGMLQQGKKTVLPMLGFLLEKYKV